MKKEKTKIDNLKKNFVWNVIGVTLNAFNSLFFMIIVTRLNGVNEAGIFTFAFTTATLFNIIGVYSGRVYQVTDNTKATDNDFIVCKIFTCIIMIIVSIVFIILNNYNFYKSLIILILCFLKMLEAFAETIYAVFQKKDYLYKAGISLTIKSLVSLVLFWVLDLITHNILISVIGILVAYIIIMLSYDFINYKNIDHDCYPAKKGNVCLILKYGFNTFLISFLILYLINSPKYVIDNLLVDKYQTIFGILLMPATVILLVTQFIINPFLNTINNYIQKKDYKNLTKIINIFGFTMFIVGIVVVVLSYTIGIPILEFIYGISLKQYKTIFVIVMIGAVLYGMSSILSNILIAMRHTLIQVIVYISTSVFITIIEYFLIKNSGVYGACYSYSLMTLVILLLFYLITFVIIRKEQKKKCKKLV